MHCSLVCVEVEVDVVLDVVHLPHSAGHSFPNESPMALRQMSASFPLHAGGSGVPSQVATCVVVAVVVAVCVSVLV